MNRELLAGLFQATKELKLSVLYVEDSPDVRRETVEILVQFFDRVEEASNGEEGLEKFKRENFDIVITDINMPRMNGIDMIKSIKEIDRRVPIIVITAFDDLKYLMECIKIGVYGYILKPIDMDQLIESLYRVVEKLRLRQERDRAIALLEQYKKIIDESATVTKTDLKGIITYANDKFCEKSGYSREELIGKPHNIVRHPDMPSSVFKELWDTIKSKRIWHGIVKNKTKDGKAVYMKATIAPILDEKGNIVEYIAVRHDITDVMNPRKLFHDKVKELTNPLLLLCKIEDYEDIESLYDTKTIERIEEEFLKISRDLFPEGCRFEFAYNLGNGEFAFLSEFNPGESINNFLSCIKQFQENVRNAKIELDGYEYDIEVLLSFCTEKENILENARLGIKRAIKEKVDIVFANGLLKEAQEQAKQNIETLRMVKNAIEENRVVAVFQPIFNNRTSTIEKYEALVRIVSKEDGTLLSPASFLNMAKIGKYYKQITSIMLEHVLGAIKKYGREVALNLSSIDIEDVYVRSLIMDKLILQPDLARKLVIELLEDESIHENRIVGAFIKSLKKLGVKIAIDDFGSGYSNFVRLLEYQPDYIKIDASLIRKITEDEASVNIVETIKSFADKQGYKTVAEFVSSGEIFEKVKSLGIDYSQGYYIGKPQLEIKDDA